MHHYKIVLLDHRYHVRSVEEIDFETDEIACERAKTLYGERAPHAVEVWHGARFVCRVNEAGINFAPPPPLS